MHEDPRDISLSRDLQAPRELVWAALSDPLHLGRWWGPSGFRTETHSHDLRPGGTWRLTMHGPDGRAYLNHVVFDEVEPPVRVVLRYPGETEDGPPHHVTTITLDELGPRHTRITLSVRFPTAEQRRAAAEQYGAAEGGKQTLARLDAFLGVLQGASEVEGSFVIRRVIAASQERVWAAWTDAAHLNRWFHPEVWSVFHSELDLRVGGTWFYGFRGAEVPETWALWRFTELDPPRRLSFVLSFADAARNVTPSPFGGPWPAHLLTTVTLEPHAGIGRGTLLTVHSVPVDANAEEVAAFRAMIPSMEGGWGQTLDSLVQHLVDLGPA